MVVHVAAKLAVKSPVVSIVLLSNNIAPVGQYKQQLYICPQTFALFHLETITATLKHVMLYIKVIPGV